MKSSLPQILEHLEAFYGKQEPSWPTDPYLFLVWWHCGYPASDAACQRGRNSLKKVVGVEPRHLLTASLSELTKALAPGGMVPELRATRLKQIAARVDEEFGGDLSGRLFGSAQAIRKVLKSFPILPIQERIESYSSRASSLLQPFRQIARTCWSELHMDLSCQHRRSNARLFTAQTAWPGTLQAHQTKM